MQELRDTESGSMRTAVSRRTVLRSIVGGAVLALSGAGTFIWKGPVHHAAAQTAGPLPLADAASSLEPPAVWENFYDLTQIPRPSHHEEQVSAFLAQFGRDLGLDTEVDDVGNVIIRKPATPDRVNRTGMILQAHMDMVPQKTPESTHNFETDPIDAIVEDGWVRASGTTLGADDGIGVALIMALLQANDVAHGPLEALFTVNEEDGFTGANAVQPGVLQGNMFINVDSEQEGVFTIGSAGGVNVDATTTYEEEATPDGLTGVRLDVKGLEGGHSGLDIGSGRGNAIKVLVRLLNSAEDQFDLRVATVSGGDRYNAIPREAAAVVAVPDSQAASLVAYVAAFAATIQQELAATDPEIEVVAASTAWPTRVMAQEAQRRLIDALNGCPNGVMRMSDTVPGLVETSTNLGILQIAEGQLSAGFLVRSAIDSERDAVRQMIESVFANAAVETSSHDEYSGWQPDPESPLVELASATYRDLFGKDVALEAVHAGLETSVIGAKYPDLDMLSLGPTMHNVHSPDEQLEIDSVGKVYDLLVAILQRVPERSEGS